MTTTLAYDPFVCDLCGSPDAEELVHLQTGRAMRSDRLVVSDDLHKLACARCGLVRDGVQRSAADMDRLYGQEYTLSTEWEDHVFFTAAGPIARSVLVADWLTSAIGTYRWRQASRVLEVGAGAGLLLKELAGRFESATFEGLELSQAAAAKARERGLTIHGVAPAALGVEPFDLIYAVAVVEHVTSPTAFLTALRALLRPGGLLLLCQPTQDVPSYDVFFVDHLYHFGTAHLRAYAQWLGFRELAMIVGHEIMPNFSLHLWQVDPARQPGPPGWDGAPAETTCGPMARTLLRDMDRLDATIADLSHAQRRIAAFGLNEVYWLARSYSALGTAPIVCGLDDRPDRPEHARLGFPVMTPEQCVSLGVTDVLLTMNTVYYSLARERLARLGLTAHPVLSATLGEEEDA
jgi:2-polyprenyl-3-methyl-5-hydroxy-6-metoxy-1,4-benzoquinol methylase